MWQIARHGNAGMIAFIRSSPGVFKSFAKNSSRERAVEFALRVMVVTREVAEIDSEAALACFKSSVRALKSASIEQFEEWAREGLTLERTDSRTRRSYYALETKRSNETLLESETVGLPLEKVQHLLQLYIEALTGRTVEVAPLAAFAEGPRIGDGHTIHLPPVVAEFNDSDRDFRLYKVLAAHAAGQIEFGTYELDSPELRCATLSLLKTTARLCTRRLV